MLKFGIIDGEIKEPVGGAHHDYQRMCDEMKTVIKDALSELSLLSKDELKTYRYNKFRKMGAFLEG